MNETKSHLLRGSLCTMLGGVCWGFSGTCGQYLFTRYGVSSLWLTCLRLLSGGVIMLALAAVRHRRELLRIWRSPADAAMLVGYGVFGLMMCQYAYMTSISYSNAGTTTVLQTLSLVIIMLLTCLRLRRRPNRVETVALVLALLGTFLLATGGDPAHMVLSPQGLFWGLATAVAVTVYTLLPRRLLARWNREAINGWGMLIGGAILNLGARSWTLHTDLPLQGWLAVAAIVLFGTVLSFTLFMQGIQDVGPVKSSMLAATEPVSATVFSAVWLGTAFSAVDLMGFAAIIATIFLLARSE
ncbi:DMT family transporter [Dysosmobacter sp.]|uniref:DMT family transporter n=1 Tax=Dysosmobacter sp. TaxID=2591382 RepID=UPI001BB4867C|nr:EamA family transporter [Dysosmobacter sp. Marseille-Q4140]